MRYHRALRLNRKVWISDGIVRDSPGAAKLIKQAVASATLDVHGTRWQLIDRDAFSGRAALGRSKAPELMALGTPAEERALAATERPYTQSLTTLASKCRVLLVSEGLAGTCGR